MQLLRFLLVVHLFLTAVCVDDAVGIETLDLLDALGGKWALEIRIRLV